MIDYMPIDVDDIAYRPRPCIWTYKGPAPVASDKRTAEIFTKRVHVWSLQVKKYSQGPVKAHFSA